jgi:hypothetical protein
MQSKYTRKGAAGRALLYTFALPVLFVAFAVCYAALTGH